VTSGDASKNAEPALHEAPAVAVAVAVVVVVLVLLPAVARGFADFLLPLPVVLLLLVLLLVVAVGVLGGGAVPGLLRGVPLLVCNYTHYVCKSAKCEY
jgi:hypothetical protein